ncbi:unnamed protein product [Cuscuta epithymum]|uniref:WRKY domain-containing protein n=1 Tax=Cuscuta epithymum TaxID=186058 RepID=A0AAV0ENG8_9ASTE|nr:unnamed protein product [Cuscuta epithymum]
MGECIVDFEDNCGLQAVVHHQPSMDMNPAPNHFFFTPQSYNLFGDSFVESRNDALLEELYKPFYQLPGPSSSSSPPFSNKVMQQQDVAVVDLEMKGFSGEASPPSSVLESTSKLAPKHKTRKNGHKRVVIQVGAEELSKDDKWAWRKYGQKPIKGSPYPRSYYRCSSAKGCLARKQVEKSNSKPGMFIVTYTAEHSHSHPTRRNSLAGTMRNNKFIAPASAAAPTSTSKPTPQLLAQIISHHHQGKEPSSSSSSSSDLSPASSKEEAIVTSIKDEERLVEISGDMAPEKQPVIMDDGEDFFAGLEDLEGLMSQFCYSSLPNYPSRNNL